MTRTALKFEASDPVRLTVPIGDPVVLPVGSVGVVTRVHEREGGEPDGWVSVVMHALKNLEHESGFVAPGFDPATVPSPNVILVRDHELEHIGQEHTA